MPTRPLIAAAAFLALALAAGCAGDFATIDGSLPGLGGFSPVEAFQTDSFCEPVSDARRYFLSDRPGLERAVLAGKAIPGATTLEIALTCPGCVCRISGCVWPRLPYDSEGRILVSPESTTYGDYTAVAQIRKLDAACQPVAATGGPIDGSSQKAWQAQSGWFKTFRPPYRSNAQADDEWLSFELQFEGGTIRGAARIARFADISDAPGGSDSCSQRSLPAPQGCGP